MPAASTAHHIVSHRRAAVRRRARRALQSVTTNLTPMIDIVFNLLIFFLVGASFRQQEGLLQSKLPSTTGLDDGSQVVLRPIRVRLRRIGESTDARDCEIVVENISSSNQPVNFAELYKSLVGLKDRAAYSEDSTVVLEPAADVRYGHVVNAYNAATRARFKSINFSAR